MKRRLLAWTAVGLIFLSMNPRWAGWIQAALVTPGVLAGAIWVALSLRDDWRYEQATRPCPMCGGRGRIEKEAP